MESPYGAPQVAVGDSGTSYLLPVLQLLVINTQTKLELLEICHK